MARDGEAWSLAVGKCAMCDDIWLVMSLKAQWGEGGMKDSPFSMQLAFGMFRLTKPTRRSGGKLLGSMRAWVAFALPAAEEKNTLFLHRLASGG